MPMVASRQADDVFELRLVLRGVNPLIWRRLLVRADANVADLHYTIQIAMGWERERQHSTASASAASVEAAGCSLIVLDRTMAAGGERSQSDRRHGVARAGRKLTLDRDRNTDTGPARA